MAFANQFGSINDDQQTAFEKSMGADVQAHLNSLIDKGASLTEVRLAVHHLMASIYMVEVEVILEQQIKAQRSGKTKKD